MPKVVGYTPSWLSRPSAGAKIFSDPEPQSPVSRSQRSSYFGSNSSPQSAGKGQRLIANRGTEIFTVVGNKIRWADLSKVKDDWEDQNHGHKSNNKDTSYRTLITPVYYQITQLIISPSGVFLAVCTEHTVHIAVLPDRSRLTDQDTAPLKLKTFQLGPTIHVIPESPLASVAWHPHAVATNSADCLVTVTAEAAVRVWEIDRNKHWSFEQPALAIDLRKLADGVSSDQNFEPSAFGKNKGFSVDAFEMEASAACFGGRGTPDEDAWAGMTLWIAMSNGDIYALCPLLPTLWMPTPTTIPALSISAVSRLACTPETDVDRDERKIAEQQFEWVQEIDAAEPVAPVSGSDPDLEEIRSRPSNPSAVPRLQGPFELHAIDDLGEGEVADIHVIAARLDDEALLSGEEDFEFISDGIQFTIICMSTTTGKVVVALELEGVSGQWLPKKERSTFSVPTSESRDLVLLETVSCTNRKSAATDSLWPLLTANPSDPYSIFTSVNDHVKSISVSEWASRVGLEFGGDNSPDPGLQTRLAVACRTTICVVQDVLSTDTVSNTVANLSAPVLIHDLNLGDMLLTLANGQAQAALFDVDPFKLSQSMSSFSTVPSFSPSRNSTGLSKMLEEQMPEPVPTRAPYVPAEAFYKNQMQPYDELRQKVPATRRSILTDQPLRLSPACLDVMTMAHRAFSAQTSNIEKAAAELFRRCGRLREELADQVKQMSELADRLQHITSETDNKAGGNTTFESRITQAQNRQKDLVQRYEKLRRKTARVGTASKELSQKEQSWIQEIEKLDETVSSRSSDTESSDLNQRYKEVQSIAKDLLEQCKNLERSSPLRNDSPTKGAEKADLTPSRKLGFSVSSRLQKERINDVMAMVERESAIIEAVMTRLNKLNVSTT